MHDAHAGTVEVRRDDGIAILTLTRPTANNRITRQMAEAGVAALENARSDPSAFTERERGAVAAPEVVPKPRVLQRAIGLAASTRHADPDIVCIRRDLYDATRCATPHDANERARFALMAALKALEESPG